MNTLKTKIIIALAVILTACGISTEPTEPTVPTVPTEPTTPTTQTVDPVDPVDPTPNQSPNIFLFGDRTVTLFVGQPYNEHGATANDPEDGNLIVSITGSVDTANVGEYILTYTATDNSKISVQVKRTVNILAKVAQSAFSIGDDQTIKRDASSFTLSVSGNLANSVAYNSSNTKVATVGVSSGIVTVVGVGNTEISAFSSGNFQYESAESSFDLTVEKTIWQIFSGGLYINIDPSLGKSMAYNPATGKIEEVFTTCTTNANSSLIHHFLVENDGDILRCSKGVVFAKSGTTELDGQADFVVDTTTNSGVDIVYAKGFADNPDDPSGSWGLGDVPTASSIPLGTTQTLNFRGVNLIAERKIYDDGSNPAGTYEFVVGDFHIENDPSISAGDTVTNCEEHTFTSSVSREFVTIICEYKGPVLHTNNLENF